MHHRCSTERWAATAVEISSSSASCRRAFADRSSASTGRLVRGCGPVVGDRDGGHDGDVRSDNGRHDCGRPDRACGSATPRMLRVATIRWRTRRGSNSACPRNWAARKCPPHPLLRRETPQSGALSPHRSTQSPNPREGPTLGLWQAYAARSVGGAEARTITSLVTAPTHCCTSGSPHQVALRYLRAVVRRRRCICYLDFIYQSVSVARHNHRSSSSVPFSDQPLPATSLTSHCLDQTKFSRCPIPMDDVGPAASSFKKK